MYFWSVSLVYQLSGQFLIFLVDQKKFWYTKTKFGIPKKDFGIPKRNLVDQKKNLDDQKKDLVYQKKIWSTKKMRNWPDNWYTKETDQKYMDAATVQRKLKNRHKMHFLCF